MVNETKNTGKFKHREAFCVMEYSCKCGHKEAIWNSRDGVTPFCMVCPSCGSKDELGTLMHSNFHNDFFNKDHVLNPNQKFWRDGTPDEAVEIIRKRYESFKGTEWEKNDLEIELILVDVKRADNGEDSHWHEFRKGWPMLDANGWDKSK